MAPICRMWSRCRPATRRSRCLHSSSSPRRPPRRRSTSSRPPPTGIKANFFEYLYAALQFVPPSPEDTEIRAKLASIGIGPGKTFEFKDLSPEHKAAVLLGMKQGDEQGGQVSGLWLEEHQRLERRVRSFGDRAFFNGNWLMRAAAAKGGTLWERCRRGHVSLYARGRRRARRSMAASTNTRSPSPPGSSRR